jgi:hypothetical protein
MEQTQRPVHPAPRALAGNGTPEHMAYLNTIATEVSARTIQMQEDGADHATVDPSSHPYIHPDWATLQIDPKFLNKELPEFIAALKVKDPILLIQTTLDRWYLRADGIELAEALIEYLPTGFMSFDAGTINKLTALAHHSPETILRLVPVIQYLSAYHRRMCEEEMKAKTKDLDHANNTIAQLQAALCATNARNAQTTILLSELESGFQAFETEMDRFNTVTGDNDLPDTEYLPFARNDDKISPPTLLNRNDPRTRAPLQPFARPPLIPLLAPPRRK